MNDDYIYNINVNLPSDSATISVIDKLGNSIFDIHIKGINKISDVAVDIKQDVIPVINKLLDIFKDV